MKGVRKKRHHPKRAARPKAPAPPKRRSPVRRTRRAESKGSPPVRWSLLRAAEEFGRSREFIRAGLREIGQAPDDRAGFTTRQICAAIYGDKERERILEMRDRREERERLRNEQRGQLVRREVVDTIVEAALGAVRSRIAQLPAESPPSLVGRSVEEIAEHLRHWATEALAVGRASAQSAATDLMKQQPKKL